MLQFRLYTPLAFMALFWACSSTPKPTSIEDSKSPLDRSLARLIAKGKFDAAQKMADSLMISKNGADREIAAYWKSVCWLYRDEYDSALTLLEAYHGHWTGGLRRVHSDAFLRVAREASQSRLAVLHLKEDQSQAQPKVTTGNGSQERVDFLQKENGDLRAEISRLESQRLKYQKLIKDLETIH